MNAIVPFDGNPQLVAVHLYGTLADRFGADHEFVIRTPRDAISALDANYPGFLAEFRKYERYTIIADDGVRDDQTFLLNVQRDLHIVPRIEGQSFIGPLIVGAIFPALGATATTILGSLLFAGVAFGLSLLLKPKQPEQKEPDERKDESFAFSGPENVTQQGVAVPLIYGRVFAGSVVISAGLSVADEAID